MPHLFRTLDGKLWKASQPLDLTLADGTPIAGLWMCGAATHPGGGASGLAGRNAAYEVLSS